MSGLDTLLRIEQQYFNEAPHSISEYLDNGRCWKKAREFHTLDAGSHCVVFNKLLNSPLVINYKAKAFLDSVNEFHLPYGGSQEEVDCLYSFIESFLFLPVPLGECDIIGSATSAYLEEFATGKLFNVLDLRLSEMCNFGCRHCIAGNNDDGNIMSLTQAKYIIDSYVSFRVNADRTFSGFELHYGNAEPLVNAEVLQQIDEYIHSQYPSLSIESSINTNLSLIDKSYATWLRDRNIQVYTSLDGDRKGNDAIRVYKDGKGTYDNIISKLEMFKEIGYPIRGISTTITDKNYAAVGDNFVEWCISQGFQSVAYDFDLVNTISITVEEASDFLVATWQKFNQVGVEFYGTWATPFLNISNKSYADTAYSFCKAKAGRNLSVNSNGLVYSCSFSSKPICPIHNLAEAIKPSGEYYSYVQSNLLSNFACSIETSCQYKGACIGQCDMTKKHSIEKQRYQCEFYRILTDKLLIAQSHQEDFE